MDRADKEGIRAMDDAELREGMAVMERTGRYPDGVTKITDPLYKCVCRRCRRLFWGVLATARCPDCGGGDVFRSFRKEEAEAELLRLQEPGRDAACRMEERPG